MLSHRVFAFLYTGLIATLPLFSVRPLSGGLSLPLLFFSALALAVAAHISITRSIPVVFSLVDHGICLYMFSALLTLFYNANPEANFAITKSIIYFANYLGLKAALGSLSLERIQALTRRGLLLGTALIILVALLSLQKTNSFGIFSKGFSYNSVTVRVFSAIDTAFGQGRDSFRSVDVMRNAVAEAFALYVVLALTLGFRNQVIGISSFVVNGVFALGMFSRRALLALPEMLEFHRRESEGFAAEQVHHRATLQPLFRDSLDSWRDGLPQGQLRLLEHLVREDMEHFGYAPETAAGAPGRARLLVSEASDRMHRHFVRRPRQVMKRLRAQRRMSRGGGPQ